jgi:predicted amidohydrolase
MTTDGRMRSSGRRAAEEGDELASLHGLASYSITSSARALSIGGTSMPSVFAV